MGDSDSPSGAEPAPQPPAPPATGVYPPPPGYYAPPLALALAPVREIAPPSPPPVGEPPRDRYAPDPKPRSPVWEAVKWPLRKALLGVYFGLRAVRRHKIVSLVVSALLIALVGSGVLVYQLTRPGPPALTIERPGLPAIPNSVSLYLHGQKTFNAREMWDSLDTTAKTASNGTESDLQNSLNQEKAQGVEITRYIYSGGYLANDGTSHFTIEVYATKSGQVGTYTWYFVVGPNGLITSISSL